MRKFLLTFVFLILLFSFFQPLNFVRAQNQDETVDVYFFWGDGCPHCEKEKPFLDGLKVTYPNVVIHDLEVWKNAENRKLLADVGKKLNVDVPGVPFTVVGEKYFSGWYDEKSTGVAIEDAVRGVIQGGYKDIVGESIVPTEQSDGEQKDDQEKINVPIFGEIEIKNFSLPVLTIVLGALDGFNPCAMWTLLFLISLLIGMHDRKKMWILGSAFIVASASVYFFFMAAWLNLLLFLGFVVWVRMVIGLVALVGGGYNLKEFFTNPGSVCKLTGGEKRQKVFQKLKFITQQKSFYFALAGIVVLAFAVNLVELICSAGLPAVFTQVLALSGLEQWQYYFYILFYILFFMLDDLVVFFVAMTTLQVTGITTKYSRFSHLVGGVLMLVIGLMLIFKPDWLMLG